MKIYISEFNKLKDMYYSKLSALCILLFVMRCYAGQRCVENDECISWGGNHTQCDDDDTCVCKQGYDYTGKYKCEPKVIGSSCRNPEDCMFIDGSNCTNNTCKCEGVPDKGNNTNCLPVITTLHATCRQDDQCTFHLGNFTTCRNGQCHCTESGIEVFGECYEKKFIGSACSDLEDCLTIKNSTCHNITGVCVCSSGIPDPKNITCLEEATSLNSECEHSIQCTSNLGELTECKNGKCHCVANATERKGGCETRKGKNSPNKNTKEPDSPRGNNTTDINLSKKKAMEYSKSVGTNKENDSKTSGNASISNNYFLMFFLLTPFLRDNYRCL